MYMNPPPLSPHHMAPTHDKQGRKGDKGGKRGEGRGRKVGHEGSNPAPEENRQKEIEEGARSPSPPPVAVVEGLTERVRQSCQNCQTDRSEQRELRQQKDEEKKEEEDREK